MDFCQHAQSYFVIGFLLVIERLVLITLLILGAWKALELIRFVVNRIRIL